MIVLSNFGVCRSKLESKGQQLPATFCLQLVEYPVTLTAKVDTEITAQLVQMELENVRLNNKLN
ncbi:hypothetical protein T01_13957 [Trichinella spiralis]|uniref:Uncharacterized protein n=1 Tax=Trichinella spiralis TaxID=6334 RepID=A0A0V1B6W6_TRISP|nr:hypothetical protein T01_13957 [Trichinella spiralis]